MATLAALCLVAGAVQLNLALSQFTLRWQHSIEKVEWAEDYEVAGGWLHLSQARIHGSGAGMEPPPDARLLNGIYHYRLADPWRRELVLARSEFVPDYSLCIGQRCLPLTHWLPLATTTLRPCVAAQAAHGGPSQPALRPGDK